MLDFIVNPIASGKAKKLKRNIELVEAHLKEKGVNYAIHYSQYKGHAKEITSELIEKGATDIICVGGDGTLHEIINGFTDFSKTNLGLLPCGTGNDFANALGLPKDVIKSLDIILNNKPKYTDFLQLPTVRCINIAGIGVDVEVLKKYEALKKKTKLGYTKCLIKTLLKFDYSNFKVESPKHKLNYCSFIACVANGITYGGGLPISPKSNIADGKLNFVAIKKMRKLAIIDAFLKLKKGKILTLKKTETFLTKEIKIISDIPVTVNVDGELYDNIPFEVKVVSNTLKMYR